MSFDGRITSIFFNKVWEVLQRKLTAEATTTINSQAGNKHSQSTGSVVHTLQWGEQLKNGSLLGHVQNSRENDEEPFFLLLPLYFSTHRALSCHRLESLGDQESGIVAHGAREKLV